MLSWFFFLLIFFPSKYDIVFISFLVSIPRLAPTAAPDSARVETRVEMPATSRRARDRGVAAADARTLRFRRDVFEQEPESLSLPKKSLFSKLILGESCRACVILAQADVATGPRLSGVRVVFRDRNESAGDSLSLSLSLELGGRNALEETLGTFKRQFKENLGEKERKIRIHRRRGGESGRAVGRGRASNHTIRYSALGRARDARRRDAIA